MMNKALLSPDRLGSVDEIRGEVIKDPWQKYFIAEETLGRGKFAVVKKCAEKSTGKKFAAKCIRKRRHCRDCTQDILHEIAVLELSSSHPNLIDLYKIYESSTDAAGGEIFDYCVGLKGTFTESRVCQLFKQILEAIEFLHDQNIVHLDLKPQNILLTNEKNGDIKLVDFGLSKHISENLEIREILGTPDYVAPEVLNFEPISTLTDIWSLGVVCYVMLTGVSPFLGDTKTETLMNVTSGVYEFPPDLFGDKDSACQDFISKMLQVDPENRLSAKQCLRHMWLSHLSNQNSEDIADNVFDMENSITSNSPLLITSEKELKNNGVTTEDNSVDENDNWTGGGNNILFPVNNQSNTMDSCKIVRKDAKNTSTNDTASLETNCFVEDVDTINHSEVKPIPKRPRIDNEKYS